MSQKMKHCAGCNTNKGVEQFNANRARYDGLDTYCRDCKNGLYLKDHDQILNQKRAAYLNDPEKFRSRSKTNYRNPEKIHRKLLYNAKRRAKLKNLPFDIDESDVIVPKICPVLGIRLAINNNSSKENSPSLDRIVPEKGYVKGNVIVISLKANQIKNNSTIGELEAVYKFYRKIFNENHGS